MFLSKNKVFVSVIISTLLAISSASSSNHGPRKNAMDLSWLFSVEDTDPNSNEKLNETSMKKPDICETKECRQIAEEFLSAINKSADPCQDFYAFTCGKWGTKKSIPKYEPVWSRTQMFETIVHHRIRGILETEAKKTDILPVRQAKKWYQSCMNQKSRELRGLKPIESILMQTGGWPMTMDAEEWIESDFKWQKVDEHFLRVTGETTFFKIRLRPPYHDEKIGRIIITTPEMPFGDQLPLKYRNHTGDDYVAYTVLIQGIAKLFIDHNRADVSDDQLEKDIKDMINLEKMIYHISRDETSTDLDFVTGMKDHNLKNFINFFENDITQITSDSRGEIHWRSIFEQLFSMINIEPDDSTSVRSYDMGYLVQLLEILKSTSKRTIINYIHWKFVSEYMRYTTDEASEMFFELEKDEYGVQERKPRWQDCVIQMKMTDAAAYVFVSEYYRKEKQELVEKALFSIRDSIKIQIKNSNWMDEGAKSAAIAKMDEMHLLVGFPDWYKNKTAVIHNYKGLTVGTEYLDNVLSFVRFKKKEELKLFVGEDRREPWPMDPITINALYGQNTIVVPAADFQSPLFAGNVPDYVNYGTVGLYIGHEMGHGFDDEGILSSSEDSRERLSIKMLRMYYQQAKCFTKQYDKYFGTKSRTSVWDWITFKREKMTQGLKTRGENIADTTGLQAVFDAYKKILKTDKRNGELKLAGFEEFNDEQMFFISYAQSMCEISTPEFDAKNLEEDVHSPARLRVIGPVSNTRDFGEVFNCPLGSPMNPEDKCNIWMESGAQKILEDKWYRRINPGKWKNYKN